jgi:hypothetical protein
MEHRTPQTDKRHHIISQINFNTASQYHQVDQKRNISPMKSLKEEVVYLVDVPLTFRSNKNSKMPVLIK